MTPESKQSHSWVRVGSTYAGVVADKISALVYHAGAQRGTEGGPAGERAEAGPGWYLVWIDEPHRHYQLSAPAAKAGASAAELEKNTLAALAEAGDAIEAKAAASRSNGAGAE